MQSMPYYSIPYPSNSYGGNDNSSRQDSSEMQNPTAPFSKKESTPDPLGKFVAGKLAILNAAIEQVATEVEEREKLRDRTLHDIDKAICEQKELLYQVAPHGSSPFTIGDSKRRSSIEKELSTLEAEQRRETTAAWKDIANLKKELRALLREEAEEKRRQEVIGQ